ncbi:MAG: AGE family epimerase/isomerase [Pseudomonadota bacterium]
MPLIKPVILCGGSGTRLWPVSVPARPKQFQSLISSRSMLAETAGRLQHPAAGLKFDAPLVVGSARHEHLIKEAVPQSLMILEPFGRDSAPAIAAAAVASDPDSLLLVLPADHHINDLGAFMDAIVRGVPVAQAGRFVTFGIQPTEPATAYGYIKAASTDDNVKPVDRFVEKPDRLTAESYLAEGSYFWNAGIFLFKAQSFIEAAERLCPDIVRSVRAALGSSGSQVVSLDPAAFAQAQAISVDYAIMEPVSVEDGVAVVPVDMGWSDVGDHASVYRVTSSASDAVSTSGPAVAQDSDRISLRSSGPLVAAIGLKDLAVVATNSAVLVADLDRTQDVKAVAQAANGFSLGFLLPEATRWRIRHWLMETALPRWAEHSWNDDTPGFKETLDFKDFRENGSLRRSRVQMRQIYAFAHAHVLGWEGPARELVSQGIDYLYASCWRDDRGFVHHIARDGDVLDDRMDAYDHAFAMIALAWSYRAGFLPDAGSRIEQIVRLLDQRLGLPGGGFQDNDTGRGGLRANPHMHLLEAFLALFEAFGEDRWLRRAGEIVTLFEEHFFDPRYDCVLEHFDSSWRLDPDKGDRIEPGHAYEWASLLSKYEKYSAHDTASWRRRLIAGADRAGRDPATGFVYNVVSRSGTPIDASRRLWPQTEMFKAKIVEPGAYGLDEADQILTRIFETYLSDAPEGFLMDSYDDKGEPSAKVIPGSMLYHMITAFAPVIDGAKA